jgi:hypothetical protein
VRTFSITNDEVSGLLKEHNRVHRPIYNELRSKVSKEWNQSITNYKPNELKHTTSGHDEALNKTVESEVPESSAACDYVPELDESINEKLLSQIDLSLYTTPTTKKRARSPRADEPLDTTVID